MNKERASLGFDDSREVPTINPDDWKPKPAKAKRARTTKTQVRKAAEDAGFQNREPQPQKGRPKTGRDVARSVKVSQECSALMDALYEQFNAGQRVKIPMGEVVMQAFEALQEKLDRQ